ncbi:MAG: hypothetical protein JST92_01235 [Deltaproteobacteria bacterium]|nr:hypothetical protein [Deltaproteobacteria bacterium]
MKTRMWVRGLVGAGFLSVALVAAMGLLHTPMGRPLRDRLFGAHAAHPTSGVCPFGYGKQPAQADDHEGARQAFAASHRGTAAAHARPALGFTLDHTTRAEVLAWAAGHRIACAQPRVGADLSCEDVPAAVLPEGFAGEPIESLWFDFGKGGVLRSVTAVRKSLDAQGISAAFASVSERVAMLSGADAVISGNPSAASLRGGLLRQASAEVRLKDYYALARETNLGDGFTLTEEYRSLD